MPFVPKKQAFNAHINEVVLGVGDKATAIGGQNVLPFHTFDAEIKNAPKIGVELTDLGMEEYTMPGEKAFYEGCTTVPEMAKRAESLEGASFICLHLEGADPNGLNKSVEECVQLAKDVSDATTLPLVIMGCKNIEKDGELFSKIAEALQGKNILVLSARSEDYKTVGASVALAYGQKVGAETADDINLAKQLNIMLKGLTVSPASIVMNVGTAAVGYGYEYVASTLDRVRLAALAQSDADLQMPIIAPVSPDTWGVKESTASEEDEPTWGSQEERAIGMEVATAAADLTGGADAVIMRHPAAVATIKKFINELM
ncbi:MAG: acetyl-CoA decarbonylase/synthase complex subunit delta [Oscillospiraceae bacterium]|nr:acetyl-CoA decarbonylase/synthase complex subunit delta [Oscillospiraceae bacterium]